ncbi:hypothetical protein JCM10213_005907 [Rhodosporidiobolus nylandii]
MVGHLLRTFHRTSLARWARIYSQTGSAQRDPSTYRTMGRPRALNRSDVNFLLDLLRRRPRTTLTTLRRQLALHRHIHVSNRTVGAYLRRYGWTRKRVERRARQRDEMQQMRLLLELASVCPQQVVACDEVHFDGRDVLAKYGWSEEGEPAIEEEFFSRSRG